MNEKERYLHVHARMCPSHAFRVARNIEGHPGKWLTLDEIDVVDVDHYTIRPCEIVFDIDFRQWRYTRSVAQKIMTELRERGFIPVVYHTGGKGVHIHARFSIDPYEELAFYDFFRKEYAVSVLKAIHLLSYYGRGRPIDAAPVRFSSAHAGHMIRAPGGIHKRGYKSLLIDGFRDEPVRLREDVVYEDFMPLYDLSAAAKSLQPQYKKSLVKRDEEHVEIPLEFMLPCIQRIVKGPVMRGSRNSAAKALAVSAARSKASQQEFLRWARKTAKNFESRDSFKMHEALSWYEWALNNHAEWWCEDVKHVRVRGREVCAPRCAYRKTD